MPELIVLTCASGKQCSHIIPLLYQHPSEYRLRLIVHSQTSQARLEQQYPEAEVLQANLGDPSDCARILRDATVIYYIGPSFQPHEAEYGINIIDSAVAESTRPGSTLAHFIFSSVIHPLLRKLLNHDRKRYVEEYLVESPLPYTILQPSHFADNGMVRLVNQLDVAKPVFKAFHNPEVAFSFTCLCDHAEASVTVIQERSKHFYATYQLVSTFPVKYTEYIKTAGDEMGKDFEIEHVPYEQAVDTMCEFMFGTNSPDQRVRDGPERLLLYYNKRGLSGNPNVLEWLIGRPATSLAGLARSVVEARK
jgi:uncharacterized protein YbjT (DUF2867 family)